jgi:hypothetical protein
VSGKLAYSPVNELHEACDVDLRSIGAPGTVRVKRAFYRFDQGKNGWFNDCFLLPQ